MAKVEKLHKDEKVFKIEGGGFERVRAADRLFEKKRKECNKLVDAMNKKMNDANAVKWDVIYKEIGKDLSDKRVSINTKCESLGFYLIEVDEDCGHAGCDALCGLMGD